ncbi:MAG: glycosyltransferase family 2 protein [Pyrinomonadaceae bacterium]
MRISVAIAAYNAAEYLREALTSVLAQSLQPFEIVVVDDGSSDNTREVCESFGERVRYIYQQNDGTAGIGARWKSIQESRGDWIALLDHDDRWLPEKLEKQVAALREFPDAGVVFTRYRGFGPEFEDVSTSETVDVSPPLMCLAPHQALHHLLRSNPYCPSSALILRQALIDEGPPDATGCGDWADWFRITRSYPMVVIEEYLTEYRVTPEQFCADKDQLAIRMRETLMKQRAHLQPGCADCREAFRAGEAHVSQIFSVAARTYLDQYHAAALAGNARQARSLLRQAMRAAPMEVLRPRRFAAVGKNYALGLLKSQSPAK